MWTVCWENIYGERCWEVISGEESMKDRLYELKESGIVEEEDIVVGKII